MLSVLNIWPFLKEMVASISFPLLLVFVVSPRSHVHGVNSSTKSVKECCANVSSEKKKKEKKCRVRRILPPARVFSRTREDFNRFSSLEQARKF